MDTPLRAAGPVAAGQQRGSLLVWNVSHTGPDRQLDDLRSSCGTYRLR
jgi:hypothetical protein